MVSKSLLGLLASAGLGLCATAVSVHEKAAVVPNGWEQLDEVVDPETKMRLSIAVRRPDLGDIQSSMKPGAFLSKAQVDKLRTPDKSDVDSTLKWLKENGVQDTETNRDWIHVHTTVGEAESLLKMKLSRYSYEQQEPVLRTTEYSIPNHLSEAVKFVHPIANFMIPKNELTAESPPIEEAKPSKREAAATAYCAGGVTPNCIRQLYGLNYSTPDGKSSIRLGIAGFLEEFANYMDLQQFLKVSSPSIAATGYNFTTVLVNNGTNPQDPRLSGMEAALDLDYAMSLGYPAQVTYYSTGGRGVKLDNSGKPFAEEFTDNEPYLEYLQYLLDLPDDKLPHVLSFSYADDELTVPKPYALRVCELFGLLTARGTTVLGGSGDGGAQGSRNSNCRTNDGSDRDVTMAVFPATCPWVTAVGATSSYTEPPSGAVFSGGGFSQYFAQPKWQKSVVNDYVKSLNGFLKPYYNPNMRAIPDFSAVGTQFITMVASTTVRLEGTSASTPLLAAMIALVNDARVRKGKPVLGWINEVLYRPEVRAVMQDITQGRSKSCRFKDGSAPGGWPAAKGWDAITGLGVPNRFSEFMRVLLEV